MTFFYSKCNDCGFVRGIPKSKFNVGCNGVIKVSYWCENCGENNWIIDDSDRMEIVCID